MGARKIKQFFRILLFQVIPSCILLFLPLTGYSDTFNIALVVPLSGVDRQAGIDFLQGFEFGKTVFENKTGKHTVQVHLGDSQSDTLTGYSVIKDFLSKDMDVFVGAFSAEVLPIAIGLIEKHGKPVITPSSIRLRDENGKCYNNLVRVASMVAKVGDIVQNWLTEQEINHVYILASGDTSGREISKVFKDAFRKNGGSVVGEAHVPSWSRNQDFSPYLVSLKSQAPDSVLVLFEGQSVSPFFSQYRDFGFTETTPLFVWDRGFSRSQDENLSGVIAFGDYFPLYDAVLNSDFKKNYRSRFGHEATVYSVYGYNSSHLIMQKIQKSKQKRDFLQLLAQKTNLDSPSGEIDVAFDGKPARKKTFFYKVQHEGVRDISKLLGVVGYESNAESGCIP